MAGTPPSWHVWRPRKISAPFLPLEAMAQPGRQPAGLIGSQTALGVLPAGTANVWARELASMPSPCFGRVPCAKMHDLLADAEPRAVDIGLCNGQPFLMWAGIGLDAMTVKKLEPRARFEKYLGIPEYFATTVWNMTLWHGMNLRVQADEKWLEGHYLLAVASNIRHYVGGVAKISPSAFINDGQMDLWLLSGSTLADAFRHFFQMRAGRHLTSDKARCIPFRHVRIEFETAFPIQMDGEPLLGATRVDLEVLPRSLRVLMPLPVTGTVVPSRPVVLIRQINPFFWRANQMQEQTNSLLFLKTQSPDIPAPLPAPHPGRRIGSLAAIGYLHPCLRCHHPDGCLHR